MDESLGLSTLITEDSEGLTEEELQQAQQALKVYHSEECVTLVSALI